MGAAASIIAGEGANEVGLASPEEVASNAGMRKRQKLLGPKALSETREEALGLICSTDSGEWPTWDATP